MNTLQVFIVEVIEVRITSTPGLVATVGSTYSYVIKVDVTPANEKNNVTYDVSAPTKPVWLTLTGAPKTKTLSGLVPESAAATNAIKLQVKSGALVLDEQVYTLSVNAPPEIENFDGDRD